MSARAIAALVALAGACAYDRPAVNDDDAPPAIDATDGAAALDATDGAGPDRPANLNDSDGDGHANDADNCKHVSNAHQDDADGDGIGDVCDLCPFTTDGASPPSNVDGDDLGDACGDPEADAPQCVVWFDGFGATRTLARYQHVGGAWSITGGALRQTDPGAEAAYLRVQDVSFARPRVRASARLTAVAGALAALDVGVSADLDALGSGTPAGFYADLIRRSDAIQTNLVLAEVRTAIQTSTQAMSSATLALDVPFTLALDARGAAEVIATSERDDVASGRTQVVLASSDVADRGVGLQTKNAAAAFDYLLVVTDATGPCPPRTEP